MAKLIRPDYAGFAVQNGVNRATFTAEQEDAIREELALFDVEFILMTGDGEPDPFRDGIPIETGEAMRWSAWSD